jgi:hypothetical protein
MFFPCSGGGSLLFQDTDVFVVSVNRKAAWF